MIELNEAKTLMLRRSAVCRILGELFTEAPRFQSVYLLCKSLDDAMESAEIVDEKDELLQGYSDLQDWYSKASVINPHIIDVKLEEEFNELFKQSDTALSADFPAVSSIVEDYKFCGYSPRERLAFSNLAQMLFFISFMSEKCSSSNDMDDIIKSARFQARFIENHIMGLLSDFCSILYEKSTNYGIYRYIAVVLHGYMDYDSATLKYF